ncbi:hypothetical protein [Leisingera caerulea]|uniref:hypothetical protein n=1 Tax=Leisingera caerulea TaxID=506591 RepID=UPI0021A8BB54|nr:hypothetical protein [Leisingera caerulea]UWQ84759.1 hypothetical protein K3726_06035 [Leisingera caerulea]
MAHFALIALAALVMNFVLFAMFNPRAKAKDPTVTPLVYMLIRSRWPNDPLLIIALIISTPSAIALAAIIAAVFFS